VDPRKGKLTLPSGTSGAGTAAAERRRIGRVIHDDRGTATVEWVDAPADAERTALSLEDAPAGPTAAHGYDPYGRAPVARRASPGNDPGKPAGKRDLRALSEWIKQMRELEARKRRTPDDDK